MSKPTLHLIGIFHTITALRYSHCAFTGKVLRFPKMMHMQNYELIEYSNGESESEADEHVQLLTEAELNELLGPRKETDFYGNHAVTGSAWHAEFQKRLIAALGKRLKPGDIICHPFGLAHADIVPVFNNYVHVETGIGYPATLPNSVKIFESYAWRHLIAGRENRENTNFEYVIPNYFDLEDWEPKYEPGEYIAFLGRIGPCKGMDTVLEIARRTDKKIVLCGQGEYTPWAHPNIEYLGPISGRQRSTFLRNALCMIMPTKFTEPFGGAGVEGLLCGTPLIAVNYGAFTETVQPGVNGYRCRMLEDWLDAIDKVHLLDRRKIATDARAKYSLEACAVQYDQAFQDSCTLYDQGWYTLSPERQKRIAALAK